MRTMRHIKNSIPLGIPLIGAVISFVGVSTAPPASQAQSSANAQVATIKQYCSGGHSDKAKTGGVSFEGDISTGNPAAIIAKDPDLFDKAVRNLHGRAIPT